MRLPGFDYAQPALYFVTVCVAGRAAVFGEVVAGKMRLSPAGRIARLCWLSLPARFPTVVLDAFVVMPDHLHGIVCIVNETAPRYVVAPNPVDGFARPADGALGEIVRAFKATATREIRATSLPAFGWQRSFYEHVVRDDRDCDNIRAYIANNPATWADDEEYRP